MNPNCGEFRAQAPTAAETRRFYTVMRNLGATAAAILCCIVLIAVLRFAFPFPVLAIVPALALIVLVPVGLPLSVLAGLVRPYRSVEPPSAGKRKFAWGFGSVGLLMVASLTWGSVRVIIRSIDGRPIRGDFATFADLRRQRIVKVLPVDRMVPPTAVNIRFVGSGGLALLPLGRECSFSCEVSEAEFRAFAAEKEYPLATNILRYVDTNTNDQHHHEEMKLDQVYDWWSDISDAKPEIDNYLSYWCSYLTFGGMTLVYDLDRRILYGFYSSN